MFFLKDIKDGKAKPKDPTYTGLDVCTPQNVATLRGWVIWLLNGTPRSPGNSECRRMTRPCCRD